MSIEQDTSGNCIRICEDCGHVAEACICVDEDLSEWLGTRDAELFLGLPCRYCGQNPCDCVTHV